MYLIDTPDTPASPWLKVDTAADYAHLSVNVVSRAAQRGQLPSTKVGKTRLFRVEDIDAWLGSHRQSLTVEPVEPVEPVRSRSLPPRRSPAAKRVRT